MAKIFHSPDPDAFSTAEGEQLVGVRRQRQPIALERGLDGIPKLRSAGVLKPSEFNIVESDSVWVEKTFDRPVYIFCPTSVRTIRACPDFLPASGADVITRKLFFSSITGLFRVPAAGKWFFNIPIVSAEGTKVIFIAADALGDVGIDPAGIIGASSPGAAAVADPAVWVQAAALACAASALVFAADVSRRGVSLANVSTDGSIITVSIANPAVANVGILYLSPGTGYVFGPTDKCTQQQLYAIGTAAGATLMRARC